MSGMFKNLFMCNRSEIVTNGCSGACCEKFTLPVTMNDLHAMKAEWNRVNGNRAKLTPEEKEKVISDYHNSAGAHADPKYFTGRITCSNGYERLCLPEDELDKLLDMLIPLGESEIDPQLNISIAEQWKCSNPSIYKPEDVLNHTKGFTQMKDGKLINLVYTCKYFDKENRICTNYENRPWLCQNFGSRCAYTGCGFTQKLKEAEEKVLKEMPPIEAMLTDESISELKAIMAE